MFRPSRVARFASRRRSSVEGPGRSFFIGSWIIQEGKSRSGRVRRSRDRPDRRTLRGHCNGGIAGRGGSDEVGTARTGGRKRTARAGRGGSDEVGTARTGGPCAMDLAGIAPGPGRAAQPPGPVPAHSTPEQPTKGSGGAAREACGGRDTATGTYRRLYAPGPRQPAGGPPAAL